MIICEVSKGFSLFYFSFTQSDGEFTEFTISSTFVTLEDTTVVKSQTFHVG